MSDPNDPFAAQPYIPPSQREPDTARPRSHGPRSQRTATTRSTDVSAEAPDQDAPPRAGVRSSGVRGRAAVRRGRHACSTFEMPAATRDTLPTTASPPSCCRPSRGDDGTPSAGRGRRSLAGTTALVVLAAGAGVGGAAAYDAISGDDGTSSARSTPGRSRTPVLRTVGRDRAGGPEAAAVRGPDQRRRWRRGRIGHRHHHQQRRPRSSRTTTSWRVPPTAASITVAFNDGSNAKAEILGRDPVTDLAVIKAEGKSGLQPATLGNSADLGVGQQVVAIGSPFGLESTVTSGIISELNRPVASSDASGSEPDGVPGDPDRRRDQPRQLRRPARRPEGAGHRHQLGHPHQRRPSTPDRSASASPSRSTSPRTSRSSS